ncbi:MAG: hypothetical protein LQ350_008641, partial [Teloschistes chrysophthalmus]
LIEHNTNDKPVKTIPWSIILPFIESARICASKCLEQPTVSEALAEIRTIGRETAAIKNAVTLIKNTVDANEAWKGSSSATTNYKNTRLWSQVAANNARHPGVAASQPSTFLSGSTTTEISTANDREVIVKLNDPSKVFHFKGKSSSCRLTNLDRAFKLFLSCAAIEP